MKESHNVIEHVLNAYDQKTNQKTEEPSTSLSALELGVADTDGVASTNNTEDSTAATAKNSSRKHATSQPTANVNSAPKEITQITINIKPKPY